MKNKQQKENNMNKIILIGNGFDLAHGLKTGYRDFIEDICRNIFEEILKSGETRIYEKENLVTLKMQYKSDNTNGFKDGDIELKAVLDHAYSEYANIIDIVLYNHAGELPAPYNKEENLKQILKTDTGRLSVYLNCLGKVPEYNNKYKEEIKIKPYLSIGGFFRRLLESLNLQNWVDVEEEYYTELKECLEGKRDGGIEKLNEEFFAIKSELENYLRKIQLSNNISKCSNIYKNIYSVSAFEKASRLLNASKEHLLFLNFNYTKTESLYIEHSNNFENIHIHGELDNPNNPIIFGYGDEIDDEYKLIEKENDNKYLENIKSIKYLETNNYKKLLNFIDSDKYNIFIMGHSCGISDRTLLNTLFEHENCESIKVFYHKKDDNTDNHSDIIKNIYRNFTNKPLMRKIVVDKTNSESLT